MEESTRRSSDAEDVEDDDGDEFEDDELDDESDESESSEGEGEAAGEAEEKVDGEPPMGCKHYNRGAKIVAPCCGGVFWCRLCHDVEKDEGEADPRKQHKINRFAIAECVCAQCGLRQEVRQTCAGCGLVMGAYFCKTCKFWENKARGQFHCDECGMCRWVNVVVNRFLPCRGRGVTPRWPVSAESVGKKTTGTARGAAAASPSRTTRTKCASLTR